nr:Trk system potassium transporter TrkA [uncultured Fusobacterium sp.]
MKIVIIGAGKVGELLCRDLSLEGNDIILVEQDAKILEKILANNDIMGFVGNGVSYDTQMEAEVPKADVFIAVTEKDEINIIASVIAKKLGAKYTIARVRSTDYSSQLEFMTDSLGIDLVINPELEAAKDIKQNIDFPDALNVESFLDGRLKLVEFQIDEDSPIAGVSLFDFKQKYFPHLLVCIIKREDKIIIPSGNNFIKAGDRIYITGSNSEIIKFQDALGKNNKKIKSAFIIGAGIISHYLVQEFLKDKIQVKIVELNPKKANKFSEYLPQATIINADGSNVDVLKEENFKNYDSCISITGIDEVNMFISIYAKKIGIKKIITKLNKLSFVDILGENSFQSIITPKKIIADNIVKVVRSIASKKKNLIENLYRLENNKVEAVELLINSKSRVSNIPLKDLKIKKNLIIAYIIRNNVAIFPKGTDVIKEGDRVIIITAESFFDDINNIIE